MVERQAWSSESCEFLSFQADGNSDARPGFGSPQQAGMAADGEVASTTTTTPAPVATLPAAAAPSKPEKTKENSSDDDEDDDDGEILEESPCGRWLKRREQVGHCSKIKNANEQQQ